MSTTAHTEIARCLLEPGYLDRLREERLSEERLTGVIGSGRPPDELDLAKVRLFAGFISKVQHNDLWLDLPYTRALLKLAEIEIGVFAEYRERHLRLLRTGPTRAGRVRSFLDFLDELLATGDLPAASVISTMAAHERALWELRLALTAAPDESNGPGAERCITPRDVFRVAGLAHDPGRIVEAIQGGGAAWAAAPPRPHFVCYWADRSQQRLTTTEVDEVTAAVLREIGAGTTCGALLGRLSASASPAVLGDVLDQALARTMIDHAPHDHDWASWR
ncbi:MAG TPA: hypothetical protein VFU36_05520 [Jatrophihabitans sp.]|nr:hypothetical protein [Jatrophihabitans sp.]